jgi:hypothetical protein
MSIVHPCLPDTGVSIGTSLSSTEFYMSFLVDRYSSRLALNRPRAEFSDPQIEREFLLRFLPERNRQLRSSLLFTACFYLAFGVTDFAELGYTGAAWQLLALRILVALIALGGCSAIKRRPKSPYVSVAVACTVLVMALAVFMVLCWRQPGALAWNTMSQALILMATYIYFPNRLVYSVLIGTGSSVVFGFMLMFQRQLQWDDLLTLVLLLVMGNALGYFAASRIPLCSVARADCRPRSIDFLLQPSILTERDT